MSLKQIMDETDPEARMIQMCGYLSVMDHGDTMPSNEILKCVDGLKQMGRSGLTEKRLREALAKIQTVTESNYDDADAKKLLLEIKDIVVDAQAGPK